MKLDPAKAELYAAGAAAVLVLGLVLFIALKGWKGAAKATVDAVGNTAAGVVTGIGDQVGLPDPSTPEAQDKCAAAMAAGNTFDVSLYCPASTFLKYLVTPKSSYARYGANTVTPVDSGGSSGGW